MTTAQVPNNNLKIGAPRPQDYREDGTGFPGGGSVDDNLAQATAKLLRGAGEHVSSDVAASASAMEIQVDRMNNGQIPADGGADRYAPDDQRIVQPWVAQLGVGDQRMQAGVNRFLDAMQEQHGLPADLMAQVKGMYRDAVTAESQR